MKTKLISIVALVATLMLVFTGCKKETFKLSLEMNIENAGTLAGAGDYEEGTVVKLTATPNEGFTFVNWTNGETAVSTEAEYSYTTTGADVTLTANFYQKKIVTLGAQSNTTTGGFLSIAKEQVYTLVQAHQNQADIDIFCFYEVGNDIAFGGPKSNITGIFGGGETDPVNWTTQNETRFFQVSTLTAAQFDALANGDASIQGYYDEVEGRRKAKTLTAGQVWAFKTQSATYGLIKIVSVTDGATGNVTFEYKTK